MKLLQLKINPSTFIYNIISNILDKAQIKEIFDKSLGTYGYRRIAEGLQDEYGVIFNKKNAYWFSVVKTKPKKHTKKRIIWS